MNVPLSIPQTIAVHRTRYPEALVCVQCSRLITTGRHRYKQLTDEQAAAYVCAECKSDKAEAARAFERMRNRPKPPTEAQLAQADSFCTWCRRWFYSAGQGGMTCGPCHTPPQKPIPWDNPAPAKQARMRVYGLSGYRDSRVAMEPNTEPTIPDTSDTVLGFGRAFKPGRPRVPAKIQKERKADRQRERRNQQAAETVTA